MAAISLSALAKKAAALLASNKDGRNIIGYVVPRLALGITVFLLLLPLIVLYAMLGWMGGDTDVREQIDSKIDEMVSSDPDSYADEYTAFESMVESAEKASDVSDDSIKTN